MGSGKRYVPPNYQRRAHNMLHRAIWDGRVDRKPCLACGTIEQLVAHHPNGYDTALVVQWFCRTCHAALHRAIRYFKAVDPSIILEPRVFPDQRLLDAYSLAMIKVAWTFPKRWPKQHQPDKVTAPRLPHPSTNGCKIGWNDVFMPAGPASS
jgi:hypothetical protein